MTHLDGRETLTLYGALRVAAIAVFVELPRVAGFGLLFVASFLPAIGAASLGLVWLSILTLFVPATVATGLGQVARGVVDGEKPGWRAFGTWESLVGASIALPAGLATWMLFQDPIVRIPGAILFVMVAFLAPWVLAITALTGRSISAWRLAFVVAATKPAWALSVLAIGALGLLGSFLTSGALAVVAPCLTIAFATVLVRQIAVQD